MNNNEENNNNVNGYDNLSCDHFYSNYDSGSINELCVV